VLLMAGVEEPQPRVDDGAWGLVDIAPMAVGHFLRRPRH
jgi:hypothetical protein